MAQPTIADFITSMVGGNSAVDMDANAAAMGMDADTPTILAQIASAIQQNKNAAPANIDDGSPDHKLGDVVKAFIQQKQHAKLLQDMNDFYTKKYGSSAIPGGNQ